DMPTFIKSIKDNKKLYGKTAFCIKIYLKLMDVGYRHIAVKLRRYTIHKAKNTLSLPLILQIEWRIFSF
ncbi:hypothetical protein, partial [Bacillus cereus group sp. BfR-BA-01403]|uniref:hypothetical protein n=1 Tax=Bacillus cereus group sp. BfR-BA-01403 TaxID=2920336 RepID=UPI001F58C762